MFPTVPVTQSGLGHCGALRHENGLDALPHQADHPDTL